MSNDYLDFLTADWWKDIDWEKTPKGKKEPHPELQKSFPSDAKYIELVSIEKMNVKPISIFDAIKQRKSHRIYDESQITLEELSFLLWATQGLHKIIRNDTATKRTVPSGGARHPFETYLIVLNVESLEKGIYRYNALEHKLFLEKKGDFSAEIIAASWNQKFCAKSAVLFIWTVIPYRTIWNYDKVAYKIIAQDSGHLCQNLYIACEAINAGTVAIGAYDQKEADKLLGLTDKTEFTIYMAPVGKKKQEE
ncbi:MAG: SagB/ThcOx family dehydrogenase [Candidatus Heimdallarchaeota archaeon]